MMGSIDFMKTDDGKFRFIVNRGKIAEIHDTKSFLSKVDVAEILNEHRPEELDNERVDTGPKPG
jgi:hypothetical protein